MDAFRLVLVPAVITLGVTALRLAGELQGWSPRLFGDETGGGAVVGIVWLVPVFGIYFGLTLARGGAGPAHRVRALALAAAALLVLPLSLVAARMSGDVGVVGSILALGIGSIAALPIAVSGWRALGRVLLVYALLARVPVAAVMLAATFGDWGTHYDAPPPDLPPMGKLATFLVTGLVPQLTIWVAVTVIVGLIAGLFATIVAGEPAGSARA